LKNSPRILEEFSLNYGRIESNLENFTHEVWNVVFSIPFIGGVNMGKQKFSQIIFSFPKLFVLLHLSTGKTP